MLEQEAVSGKSNEIIAIPLLLQRLELAGAIGTIDTTGTQTQIAPTIDGRHGRIETRSHSTCHDMDWLFSNRRHPGEPAFPGLALVGMVETRTGETARSSRSGATASARPGSIQRSSPV